MPHAADNNQGNASFHRAPSSSSDVVEVETTTIDVLVAGVGLSDLRLIKTDLEGEDFPALVGARETLKRWRPILALEYHRGLGAMAGHTLEGVTEFLAGELGYQITALARGTDLDTMLALP